VEIVIVLAFTILHMTVEFHTKRLLLRPVQLCDAEHTQRLSAVGDRQVPQHKSSLALSRADRVLNVYRNEILSGIERGEEWHWTLRLKEAPEQHTGVISLPRDEWDNRAYWLGLPCHGQGLMTEAVVVVSVYWFDVLGFPRSPRAKGDR
jgi:[ribosomal protein S5]-alanine N-acetyltransferase